MKIKTTPILVALAFLLTACGSGDGTSTSVNTPDMPNGETVDGETTSSSNSGSGDNNNADSTTSENTVTDDPDTVTNDGNTIRLGQLVASQGLIHNFTASRNLDIGATFHEYQSTSTQTNLVQLLTESLEESCTVVTGMNPQPTYPELPTASSPLVSAGETITITSDAGTYTTLVRNIDGDRIDYKQQAELNGSFPQGLVASIPGDVFPAYSNIAIPYVPVLRITSPTADQIFTPSTSVTWDANGNDNTYIAISFSYNHTTTIESRIAICTAIDDGSFTLPASTITELALDDNHSIDTFGVTRIASRVEINGSSAVWVSNLYGDSWIYSLPQNQ